MSVNGNVATEKTIFGHPIGLYVLFFTEMWERFSYYGMRAILLLFMTTDTAREGLGLATDTAGAIYGLYTAGVYLLTLPGGWIAEFLLGWWVDSRLKEMFRYRHEITKQECEL